MTKDPYKYFRIEGRELLGGMAGAVLEIERGAEPRGIVERILRSAHTLKGAARVVKQPEIASLAHEIEDLVTPLRDATSVPGELARAVAAKIEATGALLAKLDAPAAPTAAPAPAQVPEAAETFRVARIEIDDLDELLESTASAETAVDGLRSRTQELRRALQLTRSARELVDNARFERVATKGAATPNSALAALARVNAVLEELGDSLDRSARELGAGFDRAEAELGTLRERVETLRLLPASTIFAILERSARDTAAQLDKRITFETSGGDIRLDGHVLSAVCEGLLHAVRNAVDHGIEPEADRIARGKPAAGRIAIAVEQRAGRARISCTDDGRGIDLEAVRRAADARGIAAGDASEVLELIFRPGFSSRREVTEVSGRGIGLDVLRDVAVRLQGEARAETSAGRGTTITLEAPVSLSSRTVLGVSSGARRISIPLDAIQRTLRVKTSDVVRAGDHDAVSFEGAFVPFRPLAAILREEKDDRPPAAPWSVLVLEANGERAALGVDRINGARAAVIKPVPEVLRAFELLEGGFFGVDGELELVFSPAKLFRSIREPAMAVTRDVRPPTAPVLIVDDSLTTRTLEQSILESAGYAVELASSAEEALAMLRDRAYSLMVVDVEMPGMSGFELLETLRLDPELRDLPSILVTSRNAPEDLARGAAAGAKAYLIKSEFDQGKLLGTIRSLVGR